jgi:hypothetical protein
MPLNVHDYPGGFAMAETPQLSTDSLSVSALLAIDKICRQFEAELKAGKKPSIDAFLANTPEPQRSELRRELQAIQREQGHESGHHATLAQFVQNLVASGVMTEEQVQAVLDQLGTDQRPGSADDLAKVLHRQGHLTRFQAKAIYQGKTRRLVLGNYVVQAAHGVQYAHRQGGASVRQRGASRGEEARGSSCLVTISMWFLRRHRGH